MYLYFLFMVLPMVAKSFYCYNKQELELLKTMRALWALHGEVGSFAHDMHFTSPLHKLLYKAVDKTRRLAENKRLAFALYAVCLPCVFLGLPSVIMLSKSIEKLLPNGAFVIACILRILVFQAMLLLVLHDYRQDKYMP